MSPAYRIVTERLLLRCAAPVDAAEVRDLIARSRDQLTPHIPLPDPEEPLVQMVQRLRHLRAAFDEDRELTYLVLLRKTGEVVGIANLDPLPDQQARRFGGWLRPDQLTQGVGMEATASLIRVAFEVMGLSQVETVCPPDNVHVPRLAKALGMTPKQETQTLRQFVLPRSDYPNSKACSISVQAFDAIEQRVL